MTTCKWSAVLFSSALLLALGVGCKKRGNTTDTSLGRTMPVPAARTEGGWPLYEVPAEGFALALPSDWRRIDMNPATFEAGFREVIKQNPELEAMRGSLQQQMTVGIKFFGFDLLSGRTGFATNVNVLRLVLPLGGTLDNAVAATLSEVENAPGIAKPLTHERVRMAAGEVERLRYRLTMKTSAGQSATVACTQYLIVGAGGGYAVTLTTLPGQEAGYTPTFDKIGQSFRFIN